MVEQLNSYDRGRELQAIVTNSTGETSKIVLGGCEKDGISDNTTSKLKYRGFLLTLKYRCISSSTYPAYWKGNTIAPFEINQHVSLYLKERHNLIEYTTRINFGLKYKDINIEAPVFNMPFSFNQVFEINI